MNRLGIETISVFGMPPVEFVNLAADLGCRYISMGLTPIPYNPHGYPLWSLRNDSTLRREMIAAMKDRGISISLGEGFTIRSDIDARDRARDLELMCELGVRRINAVSMDPDFARTCDQFARLAEMADAVGVETTVELAPGLTVGDLPTALAVIRHVGRPNFRLLIDTMHFVRSGGTVAELAALDQNLIGYVQLSDAPLKSTFGSYMEEAMYERMVPGAGELGVHELVAALPPHIVVALEVPQRSLAEAGIGPRERLSRCIESTRNMLPRS